MPCREGPGDPAWLALSNEERAAAFVVAAIWVYYLDDFDALVARLYVGTAQSYLAGVYTDEPFDIALAGPDVF